MRAQPWAISVLFLLVVLPLGPEVSFAIVPLSADRAVSVWSRFTIDVADAYSSLNERAVEDCLRPKRVDCFSIQQNSWISDSVGNLVLWAQNTVELAKVQGAMYYGTFTFQAWNSSFAREPLLCKPESSRAASCRAPFYTDPVPFPHSLSFYSHIMNLESKYVLQMSNSLGAVNWELPHWIKCPCYIDTVPGKPLPWGRTPFELVAVGLDDSATAVFRNDTVGSFGPVLVESEDGVWHAAGLSILHCAVKCSGMLATGESSMNLIWNDTRMQFYWSARASDQGAYISDVSEGVVARPFLPSPPQETYLYAEFRSEFAYLTILDAQQRALGVDPQSGKRVEDIPNSSITHNSSEDLLILDPIGQYDLMITSGGNSAFNLFVSKSSNTGSELEMRNYNGTLSIGYSKQLHLNVESMNLSSDESASTASVLPVAGIVFALVGFISMIAAILFLRRKRIEE